MAGELWVPPSARQPQQVSEGLDSMIDLYDSDIMTIEAVTEQLERSVGEAREVQGFVEEAIERFGLAGFRVKVDIYEVQGPGPLPIGTYVPHITIEERLTREEFDRERMSWEVQNDILEIDPNPGSIQPDGSVRSPSHTTGFTSKD